MTAKEEYDFQIIANLMAGNGSAGKILEDLKVFLENHNQSFRVLTIDEPAPISKLPGNGGVKIKKAVICLGGDGTISETVGYVLNRKLSIPIALIPAGTANIIAETLSIPRVSDFSFLLESKIKKVDVGVIEYESDRNYFLLGVGLGFEESFLKLTKEKFKKKMGVFSYIFAALSELLALKKIPVVIETGEERQEIEICLLTVLNLKPKLLKLFPLFGNQEIKGDDGQLNIYYVEYHYFFQAFLGTLVFHVLGGRGLGLVGSSTAKEFRLLSSQVCGTQVDGELRSCLPARINFHQEQAHFLVP